MTEAQPSNLLSFRTVIALHVAGIAVMILGSEASRIWTAALTEKDLGDVKQWLENVSSSPWTIFIVGIIPVILRVSFLIYPKKIEPCGNDGREKSS
jgi:hypothetical protein